MRFGRDKNKNKNKDEKNKGKKKVKDCGICVGEYDKKGWLGVPHPSGDPTETRYARCYICKGTGKVTYIEF